VAEVAVTEFTPGGSQTLSKRTAAYPSGVGGKATHGRGPYIYTEDGRKLLDWVGALGPNTLGHCHPKINEAVKAQLDKGGLFSFPSVLEERVAEQLVDVIPCAEQIRFVKTGSEACSAAVRVARLATGQPTILMADNGYHGWHDWYAEGKGYAGVPCGRGSSVQDSVDPNVETFKYNDLDDLKQHLHIYVAAVILEPARFDTPKEGFLQGVVDLAHQRGALVIFDEMLMGARHAMGGGSEYFGVTPDLATYGKAFGAGLPLAFVAGSRDLMRHSGPISGTFSGDALALAACEAMLNVYREEDVIARLWETGSQLMLELSGGSFAAIRGYSPCFCVQFAEDHRLAMSVFVQKCHKRGVLFHPGVINASAAMTIENVSVTIGVANCVLDVMEDSDLSLLLEGECYADSIRT